MDSVDLVVKCGQGEIEVHGPGALNDVGQSSVVVFLFEKR